MIVHIRKKNIYVFYLKFQIYFCFVIYRVLLNYSYLEAVQNGEPIGILLRIAKDIDAAPALLARNILEKYCMRDNANGNNN